MELKPTMTRKEAVQFSNVLSQTVFAVEKDQPSKLTDRQKMIANLAISQLREDNHDDNVRLELEHEDLNDLVRVTQVALDDPRRIVYGLITYDIDIEDSPTHWDERGDAFRSLAVAADFVELAKPFKGV